VGFVITVLLLSAVGGVLVAKLVGVEEDVVSGEVHPVNSNAPMTKKAPNQREILFNIVNHLVK
jgi:hypothetical protein